MAELEIKLILPDSLAREAQASGLLTSQSIESLLRAEIHRRRVNNLFDAADRLAMLKLQPMTTSEVEAEIQAVRNKKREPDASGR